MSNIRHTQQRRIFGRVLTLADLEACAYYFNPNNPEESTDFPPVEYVQFPADTRRVALKYIEMDLDVMYIPACSRGSRRCGACKKTFCYYSPWFNAKNVV